MHLIMAIPGGAKKVVTGSLHSDTVCDDKWWGAVLIQVLISRMNQIYHKS